MTGCTSNDCPPGGRSKPVAPSLRTMPDRRPWRLDAAAFARAFGEASRKEAGNLRFDVLQRIGQSNHFSIVEAWKDAPSHAAHAAADY